MNTETPSWITGFTDGEGCFSISFSQRKKMNTGIEVRPSFSIGQKADSRKVLEEVKDYFQAGSLRYSARDGCYKYEIRDLNQIMEKIIPHFKKYPLKTQKGKDFEIFAKICESIKQGQHLNTDGIKEIIKDAYSTNQAGKRKYTQEELLKFIKKK